MALANGTSTQAAAINVVNTLRTTEEQRLNIAPSSNR
jgi:hypothetical protein